MESRKTRPSGILLIYKNTNFPDVSAGKQPLLVLITLVDKRFSRHTFCVVAIQSGETHKWNNWLIKIEIFLCD